MRFAVRVLAVVLLGVVSVIALAGGGISPAKVGTEVAQAYPNADNVRIVGQSCLPDGTAQVNVAWQTFDQGPQWLDLSLSDNGFAPGTFVGLGPRPADQSSQPWGGLIPGLTHFLRVNTNTQYGWQPSQTIAFTTRGDCSPQFGTGASNLSLLSQTCTSDNRVTINLVWSSSGQGLQWTDLSVFDNGFAPNTFVGLGPLPPQQSSLTWAGLTPGLFHFARVNTLVGGTWIPSQTVPFLTRNDCNAPPPTPPPVTPTPPPPTPTTVPPTATPAG